MIQDLILDSWDTFQYLFFLINFPQEVPPSTSKGLDVQKEKRYLEDLNQDGILQFIKSSFIFYYVMVTSVIMFERKIFEREL